MRGQSDEGVQRIDHGSSVDREEAQQLPGPEGGLVHGRSVRMTGASANGFEKSKGWN
jgi:hypothetical protein